MSLRALTISLESLSIEKQISTLSVLYCQKCRYIHNIDEVFPWFCKKCNTTHRICTYCMTEPFVCTLRK